MEKEIALVYLVAGVSSRFGGRIKSLEPIGLNGETLIEYSLNQATKSNFSKIVFVVGDNTENQFKQKFGNYYHNIPLFYIKQEFDKNSRDKPWGTADALCSVYPFLDCPFVMCNGDDLYGEDSFKALFEHLSKYESCASIGFQLGLSLPEEGKANRGIFHHDNYNINSIKEHLGITRDSLYEHGLSLDSSCSMNFFALTPDALKFLFHKTSEFKERYKENRIIESLLPNFLSELINENKISMRLYPLEQKVLGITYPGDEVILRNQLFG